jgi:hypothetical protein
MTKRQHIAAILLKPELARLPEFAAFRQLVPQLVSVDEIDNQLIERMYDALPK